MLTQLDAASVARQPSLFDNPFPRVQVDLSGPLGVRERDPETSVIAAKANRGSRSRLRARVAALHRQHAAGLTDTELVALLPAGTHPGSAAKRRCDLVRVGLLADSGERRLTAHGSPAIVWRSTVRGHVQVCGCAAPELDGVVCTCCGRPNLAAMLAWSAA